MTVADRVPRRICLPMTEGSACSVVDQKRCVRTATPAALGPSSPALINRPSTGRSPIVSKYLPSTTPARTTCGSPSPTIVKPIVEKPVRPVTFFKPARMSSISGTENVVFSVPTPGAL